MNRRDFFFPRNLLRTAGQISGLVSRLSEAPAWILTDDPEVSLLRFSRRAMATSFEIVLPFGISGAAEVAQLAFDKIDALEDQMTVYRPSSHVSDINARAATSPVTVEANLFALFQQSADLTRDTDGAFDIAAGALIKTWGFFGRQGRVPSPDELAEVMNRVGMRHVLLGRERETIAFSRPGVELNLGSIGKGHALDQAAAVLRSELRCESALLHGGHSSVLAVGSQPGRRDGWPVGIRHPEQPERRLLTLNLHDRALGTSAATFQNLEYNGRKLGHILDPRTGWPAEGVLSASATAPTAARADALATAFFILGAERTREYCEQHPEIGAVLLVAGDSQPRMFGALGEPGA